jgi:hypothetical protein
MSAAGDWEAVRSAWHDVKGLFLELRSLDLLPSPEEALALLGGARLEAMASLARHPSWPAEAMKRPELRAMLSEFLELAPSAAESGAFARLCEIVKVLYPVCDRLCSSDPPA